MKSFFIALALVLTQTASAEVRENGGFRVSSAVEVDFYSIGRGIDKASKAFVMNLVAEAVKNSKVRVFTEKKDGIEGESTICVEFVEFGLSQEFQMAIHQAKAEQVNVKSVWTCDKAPRPINPRE
jgi:hypothetical protein